MDDLLQQGITMYKAGRMNEARKIFITLVKQSPDNERAWGWMYDVSNVDKERIYCLRQMLRINPKNEKAKHLLNQLTAPSSPASPSFTQEPPQAKQVNSPKPKAKNKGFNVWIASAVAIFSVLVCSCFFGIYLMNSGTQTTTNAAEPQSDEVQTYRLKLSPLTTSMSNLHEEFKNEITQVDSNLFFDPTWRNQVNSTLSKILVVANELQSIEPVPQQLAKFDSYLDQSASENKMMVFNYQQYLNGNNYEDTTYLLKVVENLNNINTFVDLATEEMKKYSTP